MPCSQPERLFSSVKTARPVAYASDIARLALVRATLDADVSSIEPLPDDVRRCNTPGGVAVLRDGLDVGRLLVIAGDDEPPVSCAGLPTLVFARADMLARLDALEMVWTCRRRYIPAGDQVRVLHALTENGETALIEAASAARASTDGVAVVLAMACRGLVSLDLDGPLSPETRVRRCLHPC